jgi:hypothetical protein
MVLKRFVLLLVVSVVFYGCEAQKPAVTTETKAPDKSQKSETKGNIATVSEPP